MRTSFSKMNSVSYQFPKLAHHVCGKHLECHDVDLRNDLCYYTNKSIFLLETIGNLTQDNHDARPVGIVLGSKKAISPVKV